MGENMYGESMRHLQTLRGATHGAKKKFHSVQNRDIQKM